MKRVTLTYLEQTSPDELRPSREPKDAVEVRLVEEVSPEFSRFLYTAVGGNWYWVRKANWTWDQWVAWLTRPHLENWVAWVGGVAAGYIAIKANGTAVQVEDFGLLPSFMGRGIGGHLLTDGLRKAWAMPERHPDLAPITRVWLNTNSLDGPAALANYQARGLRPYRTEEMDRFDVDGPPPGPWPGANQPPVGR
jgi:GNAT superfamily N-acetyltransferase